MGMTAPGGKEYVVSILMIASFVLDIIQAALIPAIFLGLLFIGVAMLVKERNEISQSQGKRRRTDSTKGEECTDNLLLH
jgi:hypothetical protein